MDLQIERIGGLMFGLESVRHLDQVNEDLAWVIVFDCFILRFTLVKWKKA